MCLSPIRIPNPNYHSKVPYIQSFKDTKSFYINVPCGVCSECLMSKQMQLVQRARTMALDHYVFFCTLTYDNKHLPSITTSTGFDISFADISDVQNMIKRIRRYNKFGRPFKFFFVSERGKEKGRPHFHGLFFIKKEDDDDKLLPAQLETSLSRVVFNEWRRNTAFRTNKNGEIVSNTRSPKYEPLFHFHSKYVGGKLYKNFDFHYVTPHTSEHGSDDVAFYATKYLLKPSDKERRLQQALRLNLSKDEYEEVWKTVKSKVLCSKFFGNCTDLHKDYVLHGVEMSFNDSDGLKYFVSDGRSQPLAKYYKPLVEAKYSELSIMAQNGPIFDDDRDISQKLQSLEKGNRIISKVSNRDISELF